MTDQPTPPASSLEEARRRVERAWYLYDGCVDRDEVEAAVKAFARAEVIREVEADTVLDVAAKAIHDESAKRVGCPIPWEMHEDAYVHRTKQQVAVMLTAIVRALSQGGEGKA